MSQNSVHCPRCGQAILARPAPGQVLQCPSCYQHFSVDASGAAVPQAAPQHVGYATPGGYGRPTVANTPATLSLIFGLAFSGLIGLNIMLALAGARSEPAAAIVIGLLALLCPVLAVVLGIVGLRKARDPRVIGKGRAIAGLSLGGASLGLIALGSVILLPSLGRARETANRVKCGSNLRQIGQAMLLYANENRGVYPPRPKDLLLTQDITPEAFICPSSSDTVAPGTSAQQIANLQTGGHDTYIYLGAGKNNTARANVVLAYEPMTSHTQGFNALFGDGHVEFIGGAVAQKVQSELKSGQNPPPSYR
jgi:prepilin-type processing-associated H-X9-DG protein